MADIKFISGEGKPRLVVVHATPALTFSGTITYTATSIARTGSDFSKVRVGHRVSSYFLSAGKPDKPVWAKVTAIDDGADMLTVDEWVGGTPTNNQAFAIDGRVIDLPYCGEDGLVEEFVPDNLIHNLTGNRKDSEFYGYEYTSKLSYEEHLEASVILSLRPALNARPDDRLILIPRADRLKRSYNVYNAEKIKIARQVQRGHKFVVLTFKGKENVNFPIPERGWGFNYGGPFGSSSH